MAQNNFNGGSKIDEQLLAVNNVFRETNLFYSDFKNNFPTNHVENNRKIVYVDRLYKKNVELIRGYITLYESDNMTSMSSLTRIILEGIITMFYIALKETKITNYETKIEYNQNGLHRSKTVNEIIRKYKANNMIDVLYVGDNSKFIKKTFKLFNSVIHGDYRSHIENPPDYMKWYILGLIPSLNIANTFAMIQEFVGITKEKDVVKFAGKFITQMMVVFGDKFGSLIPNEQEIFEKLLFKESIRRHVSFGAVTVSGTG